MSENAQNESNEASVSLDLDYLEVQNLLKAYAKTITRFYEAEVAFRNDPNAQTLYAYHKAMDRYHVLRGEIIEANRFSDALRD